jgi:Sporulation related domain.
VQQAPTYVAPPPTYVTPDYSGSGSYIAAVASMSTESGAQSYVSKIEAAGYASDVLWSSNYSSLNPGYWVAAAGPFSTQSEAQSAADNLGSGAYVRYLG